MSNTQSLFVENIPNSYTTQKYNIELKINEQYIKILRRPVDSVRLVTWSNQILNEGKD